jgi:hypothetical protein
MPDVTIHTGIHASSEGRVIHASSEGRVIHASSEGRVIHASSEGRVIHAMTESAIAQVRALETEARKMTQVDIATTHVFHAGVYARTITIPAGVLLTGALIKCATLLIVSGEVFVFLDDEQAVELFGHTVLPARARRKVAFLAKADTHLTMLFATGATTVAHAEDAFTDEPELLLSRLPGALNTVIVTGE